MCPPPKGDPQAPLQALIIDSWFDNYVGVVMLVRVVNGTVRPKDKITLMGDQCHAFGRADRCLYAKEQDARIAFRG